MSTEIEGRNNAPKNKLDIREILQKIQNVLKCVRKNFTACGYKFVDCSEYNQIKNFKKAMRYIS